MSYNKDKFIDMLKQNFKFKQLSLNFLLRAHEEFPEKFRGYITKIAYENRHQIHF